MQSKTSTDIDRKLAIYYHPLFQQIIKSIVTLFDNHSHDRSPTDSQHNPDKFQIGLLQFVQFNLKLQKALLPSFQLDNALISALNDWVKQVAECLTYQGMVSTAGCIQVTQTNLPTLLLKQYNKSSIPLFSTNPQQYTSQLLKAANHDAFKLLGIKINKQVFSKFMFDLCSTWCQFLDVELFAYFLIGMYVQVSYGQTLEMSRFKDTLSLETIDLDFMEEFEEIKGTYNRMRKKDLRYYRAWCQWNYLRVNDVGQRLILKLDQIHIDDNRILQLAMIFQRAIQIINQQITSQNPQKTAKTHINKSQQKQPIINQTNTNTNNTNNDFLILKKFSSIENNNQKINSSLEKQNTRKQQNININNNNSNNNIDSNNNLSNLQDNNVTQDFQIEIDQFGNMYLKRIVRLPILGMKIQPQDRRKYNYNISALQDRNRQLREVSNLYGRMQQLKIRLDHRAQNDHYAYKKNKKIELRDKFYTKQQQQQNTNNHTQNITQDLDRTIHQKMHKKQQQKQYKAIQIPNIQKQPKNPIRQNNQYIHKVMAPSFLTDNQNNINFSQQKQGQIYSTTANNEKRQLKLGIAKMKHIDFRVKQLKSYHIVGKLVTDRNIIKEKAKSYVEGSDSTMVSDIPAHDRKKIQERKLEIAKKENKYIWSRYIDEEEINQLNRYDQFYEKLQVANRKFGLEFQSEFRCNLKPLLAYENKRYEMGGIIDKEDQERFSERIKRLINKEERRKKKKNRKEKMRNYRRNFKNKQQKSLFQDIFIGYHRDALRSIKKEKKERQLSMIV